MKYVHAFVIAVSFIVLASVASGQAYPSRPVHIIDGFAPGGAADILARIIAPNLGAGLGRPVVVENHPGASGNIGAELVARAPPDGYTLFIGATGALAASATLYPKLQYDVAKDYAPVGRVGSLEYVLVAGPSVPINTIAELVAAAKANPGQLNYGSSGVGSVTHLCMELFKRQSGIDLTHIAYKGGAPMQAAVLRGEIQLGCFTIPAALGQIKAGRMRPLVVTGAARSPVLPQVPTVAESGYAGAEVTTTFGLFAPVATPTDVIATLNSQVRRVVDMADIRERFAAQGVSAKGSSPEELGEMLNAEIVKWADIIKAANIRVE